MEEVIDRWPLRQLALICRLPHFKALLSKMNLFRLTILMSSIGFGWGTLLIGVQVLLNHEGKLFGGKSGAGVRLC